MSGLTAPSDAQLGYIAALCQRYGQPAPGAVASAKEASEIIDRLKSGTYQPADYAYPFGWQQDVPF